MIKYILLLTLCLQLHADPWGKDADIANRPISAAPSAPCTTPFLGAFAETMIGFHQNIISPADGPRSHFIPSSSQYTLEAMRKHGFLKGFYMGCDRLMRENGDPWVYDTLVDENGFTMKYEPLQ